MSAAFSLTHELSLLVHLLSCHPNFRQPRTVPTEAHCFPIPWSRNSELALTQNIAEVLSRRPGGRTYAVSCVELPEGLTIFVAADVSPNVAPWSRADDEDDQGLQELNETLEYLSEIVKKVKNIAAKNKENDGKEIKQARLSVRQAFLDKPASIPQPAQSDVPIHDGPPIIPTAILFGGCTEDLIVTQARDEAQRTETGCQDLRSQVERIYAAVEGEMSKARGPPEQLELYRYVLHACREKIVHRWRKYYHTLDDFFWNMRHFLDLSQRDPPDASQHEPGDSDPSNDSRCFSNPYDFIRNADDRKIVMFLAEWFRNCGHKLLDPRYLEGCLKASDPHGDDSASTNSSSSSSNESDPPASEGDLSVLLYIATSWPTHPQTLADLDTISQAIELPTPNSMPMSRIFKKFFAQFKAVDDFLWAAERRRFYTEVLNRPIIIKGVRVLPPTDCGREMRRVLPTNAESWRSLLKEWLGKISTAEFERVRGVKIDDLVKTAAERAVLEDPERLPPGSGFVCAELQLLTYFLYTGEGLGRILSRWGIDWDQLMTEGPPPPGIVKSGKTTETPADEEANVIMHHMAASSEARREIESWKSKRIPFAISKSTACQACRMVMAWAEHKKRADGGGLGNMFRSAKVLIIHKHLNTGIGVENGGGQEATLTETKRYGVMIPPTDGRFVSGGTRWAEWHTRNENGHEYGGYRAPKGCLWMLPWGLEEKLGEERILRIVQELILMLRGDCREVNQGQPPTHVDAEVGTERTEEEHGVGRSMVGLEIRGEKERQRETDDAVAAEGQMEVEMEAAEAPVPMVDETGKQEEGFPGRDEH
ncbi:dihydroxy-acid dehydratase ilv3 [Ascosphaera pollenicola]|nr:dihydroxy-acid dehydratase ilv3 [Ascosphaera pollenicola]